MVVRVVYNLLNALHNHRRVYSRRGTGRLECRMLESRPRFDVLGHKEAKEFAAGGELRGERAPVHELPRYADQKTCLNP